MEIFSDVISKARPNLSQSSIKTYSSILKNLYKKLYPEDKDIDIKKLDNDKVVLDYFKNIDGSKRKTYLSALFIISNNKEYHNMMVSDIHNYDENEKKQIMSESQKENWMSQKEINDVVSKYSKMVKKMVLNELTNKQYQIYQDYIILCLMSGAYIPPRRLKDWSEFKVKNIDDNSNCLEKVITANKRKQEFEFVFRNYKTAKFYGTQKEKCPPELYKILKPFISICKTDYLLCDIQGNKLTPVKLNQRLNKIFNKNVSCNILRHSYNTELFKEIPNLDKLTEVAQAMGHSVIQSLLYAKKDAPDGNENNTEIKNNELEDIKKLGIVSKSKLK